MSTIAKQYMVTQLARYFSRVKELIATGGSASFRYTTGIVPPNGQVVYDAPTELGFVVSQYDVYSLGIQLSMVDPTIPVNPPVVEALSVLRYEIQADGKVIIKSNYNGDVTYHARITMPVKN